MAVVRDTDRGYKALLKRVFRDVPAITVGIHGDDGGAGYEKGSITTLEVASIHEFGLNGVQRSFIGAWFDSSKAESKEIIRNAARSVVKGGASPQQAADRAALLLEAKAKAFITSGGVSPETDKAGTTLVETSQLVNSIKGKVAVL
jgi:hypothetical protein